MGSLSVCRLVGWSVGWSVSLCPKSFLKLLFYVPIGALLLHKSPDDRDHSTSVTVRTDRRNKGVREGVTKVVAYRNTPAAKKNLKGLRKQQRTLSCSTKTKPSHGTLVLLLCRGAGGGPGGGHRI